MCGVGGGGSECRFQLTDPQPYALRTLQSRDPHITELVPGWSGTLLLCLFRRVRGLRQGRHHEIIPDTFYFSLVKV